MSKYIKEGEAVPFGYGFVCHRLDMLATEVAILPLNYLIRLVKHWQIKSHRRMTKQELSQLKKVQDLIREAENRQHKKDMEWFKKIQIEES